MRRMMVCWLGGIILGAPWCAGQIPETRVPSTYLIDYADTHLDNPEYLETIRQAPPDILHVGHDVVFKSHLGPCTGSNPFPDPFALLSPEQCQAELDRVARYVDSLHQAGAKTVIPYICDVLLFGDHLERRGFWEFYDHWCEYAAFGMGERPVNDPITWMQVQHPKGDDPGDVERRPLRNSALYVYTPCVNHPDWQRYLLAVVRLIARCGYDGVFVDVNSCRCYCESCQALFITYLKPRYSDEELKTQFGFTADNDVRLGEEHQGLLWTEILRFRAWSMARLFQMIAEAGAENGRSFLVLPNLSPMAHLDGVRTRVGNGQDVGRWAETCRWLMFEEMQQSGRFGAHIVSDCTLQYKNALANNIQGGMLLYHARDRDGIALAMSEAGAGGGGALIQAGYACPEVRSRYMAFWAEHPDLFQGLQSWSQVGVCYLYEQLYWGNTEHLPIVYRIRKTLSESHVLFDFVVERNFTAETLQHYAAVILPVVRYLSDARLDVLHQYVREGGVLVILGECGTFDESGRARSVSPFAAWGDRTRQRRHLVVRPVGEGLAIQADALDKLLPVRSFELFDATEDEANDVAFLLNRTSETPAGSSYGSPLLKTLSAVAHTNFQATRGKVPPSVQVSVFRQTTPENALLVAHLVNFDVPIHGEAESGPPVVVTNLELRLPIPAGWHVTTVSMLEPGREAEDLAFTQGKRCLRTVIPELSIYKVLAIRCKI